MAKRPIFTPNFNEFPYVDAVDIEALFMALGATKKERRGSGVTFRLNGETVGFHLPHPRKEANRYQVRNARDFLKRIGITL